MKMPFISYEFKTQIQTYIYHNFTFLHSISKENFNSSHILIIFYKMYIIILLKMLLPQSEMFTNELKEVKTNIFFS